MEEQLSELQKELRRNRRQSYIFLALMVAGAIYSISLYFNLQDKKDQLEVQKEELAANYKELKENKAKLALKDSLIQRQKLMNEVIADLKVLVDDEGGDTPNDKEAILRKLQQKAMAVNQGIEAYNEQRGELIKDLYSKNEGTRSSAINALLRDYANDDQLLPDLLAYSKGKVNDDNKETVWQIIYLIDKLNSDLLKPEANNLNDFFAAADKAALVGSKTRSTINSIKNRM